MTEIRPESDGSSTPAVITGPEVLPAELRGVAGWLTTSDHKKVGILYVVTSLVVGAAALALGGLVGIERVQPDSADVFGADAIGQLSTLWLVALVWGCVVPLLAGLAIHVVPLQVGARSVAFPRMAAASYWGWLIGLGIVVASYAGNGGPGGGDPDMVDLFLVGHMMVVVALAAGLICAVTTALTLRAPGMTLARVPAFTWSVVVGGTIALLSLPVLVANLVVVWVDHRWGLGLSFGGNTGILGWILWSFTSPQVFVYAIPAVGVAGSVVPVFARNRQVAQPVALALVGLAGILAFGAWAQPGFNSGLASDLLTYVDAFGIVVPVVGLLGLFALTMVTGKPRLGAPAVFALGSMLALAGGVVAAAAGTIRDLDVAGTTWTSAVVILAAGSALLGGLGAVAFWAPKLFGNKLPDAPAAGVALLALLGAVAAAAGELVNGAAYAQPLVAVGPWESGDAQDALNAVTAAGLGLVALSVLAFVLLALRAAAAPGRAGADPWGGHTLEWATDSPPPPGNFTGPLPIVMSPEPLLDGREAAEGTR